MPCRSQVGNAIVSAVALERSSEAGGLAETDLTDREQEVIIEAYTPAQLPALGRAMVVVSLLVTATLFLALGLPLHSLIGKRAEEASEAEPA